MTTNETSFFRDIHPFEAFRRRVLPELISARQSVRRLHVWSAACSTGQEPYSLAIMLREHFPQLAAWDVKITATDLSTDVLDRARQGVYSQLEVNRGLATAHLVKHFDRSGVSWRVKEELRRMVDFRPINLIEAWPDLGTPDIVFLRNVLIYFDIPTKKDILGRIRKLLRPDGYLFLGGAESTLNIDDGYERVEAERSSIYRRRKH